MTCAQTSVPPPSPKARTRIKKNFAIANFGKVRNFAKVERFKSAKPELIAIGKPNRDL
jgi:hypothetical protein